SRPDERPGQPCAPAWSRRITALHYPVNWGGAVRAPRPLTVAVPSATYASMDYRERVVIVTGASSGIGRQVALDFGSRGASVVLSARRGDRLAAVAAECQARGGTVEAMTGDVGERTFVEGMAARALERFGRIDVVVNNAGISKHKQIYRVTPDDVDYVMRVN